MRVYSFNELDKYFLSPYVNIAIQNGLLIFYQRLFDTNLIIPCSEQQALEFVSILKEGAKEENIITFLFIVFEREDIAYEYLTLMQQMGVLE